MKKFILLLFGLQCSLCNITSAQNPGDLDISFGTDGIVNIPTAVRAERIDIALQPDGKMVTGGDIIIRFNADGSLDGTFSNDGIDTVKINDTLYNCNAISIQPDGKILVIARPMYGNIGPMDFLLLRYDNDGSPDSTFDGDGIVRTDINSGSEDHGYELAIQPDGSIIVVGESEGDLAIVRYLLNGSLDNTFDNDGKLVINTSSITSYVKLQADGKILLGSEDVLVRLNPDGSMDNSFGNSGVAELPYVMCDLAVQSDGKIALAGVNFRVVRLNTNGSLDNTFGNGGTAVPYWPFPACSNPKYMATSISLQPDGRILAGGYFSCSYLDPYQEFILTRFNPDGIIDSTFNSDGIVRTYVLQTSARSNAATITPGLKIILSGHSFNLGAPNLGFLTQYHLGWLLDVNTLSEPDENFVITPNPTADWIEIEATDIENGVWHLQLRDITGRTILQEDVAVTSGSIQKKISLNNLSAGVYMLQLDNGKRKAVSRVVKNR